MFKQTLLSACLGLVLVTGADHRPADAQVSVVAAAVETGKAIGRLPIRKSPPGPFSGKGKKVGTTVPGATYNILAKKVVPSIFGAAAARRSAPPSGPPEPRTKTEAASSRPNRRRSLQPPPARPAWPTPSRTRAWTTPCAVTL